MNHDPDSREWNEQLEEQLEREAEHDAGLDRVIHRSCGDPRCVNPKHMKIMKASDHSDDSERCLVCGAIPNIQCCEFGRDQ